MGSGLPSDWRVGLVEVFFFGATIWRVSSLLVHEEGPLQIFERLRSWMGVKYNARSERYATNPVAEAFLCVWCISVWVAVILAIAWAVWPTLMSIVILICTGSTTAIVIERMVKRDQG
jgi:hypothetical protein